MSGPLIQNFSVDAGDDTDINVDVDPDVGVTLLGSTVYWTVFAQKFSIPFGDPVLRKVSDHGLLVTDADQLKFTISLSATDTADLKGNYYHETQIVDTTGNVVTVNQGIMTVKATVNRDYSIPA